MIISFETKQSKELNDYLINYENPQSLSARLSKNSFLEFKIHRFKDLVIISQKHLFDVIAKWLLMCSVADVLFAYAFGYTWLFYVGGIFLFISMIWLSKYARFFALRLNINRKGHKHKIVYINDVEALEKILFIVGKHNVAK